MNIKNSQCKFKAIHRQTSQFISFLLLFLQPLYILVCIAANCYKKNCSLVSFFFRLVAHKKDIKYTISHHLQGNLQHHHQHHSQDSTQHHQHYLHTWGTSCDKRNWQATNHSFPQHQHKNLVVPYANEGCSGSTSSCSCNGSGRYDIVLVADVVVIVVVGAVEQCRFWFGCQWHCWCSCVAGVLMVLLVVVLMSGDVAAVGNDGFGMMLQAVKYLYFNKSIIIIVIIHIIFQTSAGIVVFFCVLHFCLLSLNN